MEGRGHKCFERASPLKMRIKHSKIVTRLGTRNIPNQLQIKLHPTLNDATVNDKIPKYLNNTIFK
mgnify:CR=1 FL=1